jgi:cysteinyl-tRNA synthetase
MDLQFPHHENEIAQSEGATGEKFVNVWMHNGFVRVDNEKMSKSLGNFFTVREVLKQYRPEIIRFFILSSHYRSPLNYSDAQLDDAETALTRLYTALRGVEIIDTEIDAEYKARFETAMNDDFNTALALAVLFDLAKALNKIKADIKMAQTLAATLYSLSSILGILQDHPEAFLKGGDAPKNTLAAEKIEEFIQQRLEAKQTKNWAMADKIRDDLKAQGIILEDAAGNITTWRRA